MTSKVYEVPVYFFYIDWYSRCAYAYNEETRLYLRENHGTVISLMDMNELEKTLQGKLKHKRNEEPKE